MKTKWADPDYRESQTEALRGRKIPFRGRVWVEKLRAQKLGEKNPMKRLDVQEKVMHTWFTSEQVSGEKNNNWKGGVTSEAMKIRKSTKMKNWRETVFERDDHTCQRCGKRGGDLIAHHIKSFADHPALRFDLLNGTTLCILCHKVTDSYMNRWNR